PRFDGRGTGSAGRSPARADRENRRWPPGVVKTRRRPASLHRRKVAGETPSTRLASESPTQSGLRDAERATKSTQIYTTVADSLTVPFPLRGVFARDDVPPRRSPRGLLARMRVTGRIPRGERSRRVAGDDQRVSEQSAARRPPSVERVLAAVRVELDGSVDRQAPAGGARPRHPATHGTPPLPLP